VYRHGSPLMWWISPGPCVSGHSPCAHSMSSGPIDEAISRSFSAGSVGQGSEHQAEVSNHGSTK
jgi:hypothetical protein